LLFGFLFSNTLEKTTTFRWNNDKQLPNAPTINLAALESARAADLEDNQRGGDNPINKLDNPPEEMDHNHKDKHEPIELDKNDLKLIGEESGDSDSSVKPSPSQKKTSASNRSKGEIDSRHNHY
jgi:hypothetical protein